MQIVLWDETLQVILDFLHLLNKLNNEDDEGNKVPYSTFHLPELVELIDIRNDYIKWISEKESFPVRFVRNLFLIYLTMNTNIFSYIINISFLVSESVLSLPFPPRCSS